MSLKPLSMTSHIIKIFERVLKMFLQSHLDSNSLLSDFQDGFHQERSCLTQLLQFNNKILNLLEEGVNCDVIFFDISKVFDGVDHGFIAHLWIEMGIMGKMGTWLMEFLIDRTQAIIFNGEISSDTPIMRGVAKGMVLGPILILVMIQNIEDLELNSIFPMFSDDMQLTHPINNLHDVELLQEDLDKLYNWEKNSLVGLG